MRNYLQSLLTDQLDLQSEELTITDEEVIQGDIGESIDAVESELVALEESTSENITVTEAAMETVDEDETTLESLIAGLRGAVAKNGGLTTEGAVFANNHIQSICKRYNIKAEANITNESSTEDNGRLTLEAAEEAKESLWVRFKNMVKAAFAAVMDFFSGLLKTKAGLIKSAESIIARAQKVTSTESVSVDVNSNAAFFLNSVNALPGSPTGADVVKAAKENLAAMIHASASLEELDKVIKQMESNETVVEKQEDGSYSEDAITTAIKSRADDINAKKKALLPFGKEYAAGSKGLVNQNPLPSKTAFSAELSKVQVIELAKTAKLFIGCIDRHNAAMKAAMSMVESSMKTANVNVARRVFVKVMMRYSGWKLGRVMASLARNSAIVCMKLADSALKKLEAK